MIAGILRERITIKKPVEVKNGYGGTDTTYEDVTTTRSAVKFNNGNRVDQNNEIVTTTNVTFTIRLYHSITNDMIVIWNNQKYRILSVNVEKEKQRINIIGDLINE